jgi:hypothetical protein
MRTTTRITAVRPGDRPLTLVVTWADGKAATVDLSGVIARNRALAPLEDPGLLARVRVSEWGWGVEWDDGLDFGTDQLRRWAGEQAGEIMPAAAFRAWRERHGLSLAAAAEALGLSRRMVAYYDNGTWPVPKTVLLACEGIDARRAIAASGGDPSAPGSGLPARGQAPRPASADAGGDAA